MKIFSKIVQLYLDIDILSIKKFIYEHFNLRMEFDLKLIGVAYDRSGENIEMSAFDNDKVRASIQVQLSPTFWGWLFQFGKQMRIISSNEVIKEYKRRAAELFE